MIVTMIETLPPASITSPLLPSAQLERQSVPACFVQSTPFAATRRRYWIASLMLFELGLGIGLIAWGLVETWPS